MRIEATSATPTRRIVIASIALWRASRTHRAASPSVAENASSRIVTRPLMSSTSRRKLRRSSSVRRPAEATGVHVVSDLRELRDERSPCCQIAIARSRCSKRRNRMKSRDIPSTSAGWFRPWRKPARAIARSGSGTLQLLPGPAVAQRNRELPQELPVVGLVAFRDVARKRGSGVLLRFRPQPFAPDVGAHAREDLEAHRRDAHDGRDDDEENGHEDRRRRAGTNGSGRRSAIRSPTHQNSLCARTNPSKFLFTSSIESPPVFSRRASARTKASMASPMTPHAGHGRHVRALVLRPVRQLRLDVHGRKAVAKRGDGLLVERDEHVLAVRDAALEAAGAVRGAGESPRGVVRDRVVRGGAAAERVRDAFAQRDGLHGGNRHQGARDPPVQLLFPRHVGAEARRNAAGADENRPAERVAGLRGRVDRVLHGRLDAPVHEPERRRLRRPFRGPRTRAGPPAPRRRRSKARRSSRGSRARRGAAGRARRPPRAPRTRARSRARECHAGRAGRTSGRPRGPRDPDAAT